MLKKTEKLLYIFTASLLLLYIISFFKGCSSKDKREVIKTALVNPKYKDKITAIELCNSENCITITKNDNFWSISEQNNKNTVPASSEMVNNLLENLTTIRNMYKLSDKIDKNSSFGLTDSNKFILRYYYDGNFHELTFGNQNFAQTGRYLITDKKATVYEIDSSFDNYLTTSIQIWNEPFIISQQVLGKITDNDVQNFDAQKLLELRHGGLSSEQPESSSQQTAIKTVKLELGNKNSVLLDFSQITEETYNIKINYYKSASNYPVYSTNLKISAWTYNKINEIKL